MLVPRFWSGMGICEISGLDSLLAVRPLCGGHGHALSLCQHSCGGSGVLLFSYSGSWIYYIYLKFIKFQLTFTTRLIIFVYSIMCIHKCCIYSTLLLYWRLFRLCILYEIRKYRTIGIIGPPTLPISPFIRESAVFEVRVWLGITVSLLLK
jgi:hypothetical protein